MGNSQKFGGGSNSIPEYCASIYYRYGLLVATHPIRVIILAIATVLALCTPLRYLPLPGYLPQEHITLVSNYSVPSPSSAIPGLELGLSSPLIPLWYQGPPTAYVQQIVVRTTVTPWQDGISVAESIRGPLFTAFHLSQIINDFHMKNDPSVNLVSECLLVEEAVGNKKTGSSLPNYNCMMVSPADLWSRNPHAFVGDRNVLSTINALKSAHEGSLNVGDILFGVPAKDVGISPKTHHPQIVTYAVTIVLKRYSEKFIGALERELTQRLSLNQPSNLPRTYMTHLYFPSRLSLWELLMLGLYIFLFLSMYFSVVKMKTLYSKIGLAFSVLVTLVATLCVAVSISAHFGWRPLHSRWNFFYPVLSGLVGFENSMALIRSILSTADHLDIKIRVAQGLAKEGWMITKYFLAMITTLTLSFFLFIPFVQEICINGSLVLLCDLYMQLIFLTAVICIDLQRSQDDQPRRSAIVNPLFKYSATPRLVTPKADPSVPNLHRRNRTISECGEDRLAPPQSKPQLAESMPRRLRVTYYVARKRLVQRMVIFGFIMWIAWVLFSSDSFSERVHYRFNSLPSEIFSLTNKSFSVKGPAKVAPVSQPKDYHRNLTTESSKILRQNHRYLFKRLLPSHWPYFFAYYNISLSGKYLTILPAITLSVPVSMEEARAASNPLDPLREMWKPDLSTVPDATSDDIDWNKESVIIPSTKGELMVTGVLLIPALAFVMYAMVALYRCVCPRNYGEWRSSRTNDDEDIETSSQIIGETVPLVLSGHPHDVECLSTDGSMIVSSCLAGTIYVWDPGTGECTGTIQRKFVPSETTTPANGIISSQQKFFIGSQEQTPPTSPEIPLSHSFPSLASLPDLTATIDVDFSSQNLKQRNSFSGDRFNHIEQLYEECKIYQQPETKPQVHLGPVQNPVSRKRQHCRNLSAGSILVNPDTKRKKHASTGSFVTRPIWCMECQDGLVFVGTGTGVLEVWDVYSCKAKCLHDDLSGTGITLVKISGNTVVAARLNGTLDILELQSAIVPVTLEPSDWTFDLDDPLVLIRRSLVKAHLQPITVLTCDESRIITGSLDHTLKVLDITDGSRLFTLHGHYGPVTTVALGASTELECNSRTGIVVDLAGVNNVVASGAQDGSLCVWDIYSGTCVYSVQAHDGTVVNIVCTSSYIISLGQDDKLCVWERFQGHLLNTLVMNQMYCTSLVMLTNRLLITGRQGSLNVWDITSGVPVRSVRLGNSDNSTFINNLLPVSGSIVCDYGNQLRVVRFPVAEKTE